jgi:hypothetical protein
MTMTEPERQCLVHGVLDDPWPCPDFCEHFRAELERRIDDVRIGGNFIRLFTDDDGRRMLQKFRNHQPDGEPYPFFRKDRTEEQK